MKKLLLIAALPLFMAGWNSTLSQNAVTAAPVKKDIALQLYSLRGEIKDYDATIKKVGEMGFTSIEAAHYDNGKFYGKTPEEFKASLEAAGMYALSSHTTKGLSDAELKSKDYSSQ